MDCWRAANLPRLALHSLSMASKARVTKPPAAPAMAAADLPPGRGGARGGGGNGVVGSEDARSGERERQKRGGGFGSGRLPHCSSISLALAGFNGSPGPFFCKNFFHTDITLP